MKHWTISTSGLDNQTAQAVTTAFDKLNRTIENLSEIAYPNANMGISNHVDAIHNIDQFLRESYKMLWQCVDSIDPRMKEEYRQARQTAAQCYADCSRIITEALGKRPELDEATFLNEITINRMTGRLSSQES